MRREDKKFQIVLSADCLNFRRMFIDKKSLLETEEDHL